MDNTSEKQEEIILPSLEEWRKLYDVALEFKQATPWDWMWDSDIFAIQNHSDGEFGYCCVLGRNREVFGLAVYLGSEGLKGYLGLVSGEITYKDPNVLHTKKCLLAAFEDKKYLSPDDLDIIRRLSLQFSGPNAWPQFQSYQPGYFPWQLTRNEALYLTLCLQQAKEVALRLKDSPRMLTSSLPGYYFTRLVQKKGDILNWKDGWHKPTFLRKIVFMCQALDENRLDRIKQLGRQKMTWELDFFYSPAYVAEKNSRPYFPLIFLWMDQASYFIFFTHMTTPAKYKIEFVEYCLRAFESAKMVPGEIQVRKEELLAYLEPLVQRLGIKAKLVKKLKAVDDARKKMEESFSRKNSMTHRGLTPQPFSRAEPKVGRNDPCPCGSGKKYKKCCGA